MAIAEQGWGMPVNSRKAHYFVAGEPISLCRRMMYAGDRTDTMHDHQDNCAECKRKRAKRATAAERRDGERDSGVA